MFEHISEAEWAERGPNGWRSIDPSQPNMRDKAMPVRQANTREQTPQSVYGQAAAI